MHIEVKASELQKIKLFVATPMYGGQCAGMYSKAAIDLATMCANYGVECRFFFMDSPDAKLYGIYVGLWVPSILGAFRVIETGRDEDGTD